MNLVLDLSDRTSLDLDFSLENDFEDLEDIRNRMSKALENRFKAAGYVVFDFTLESRPSVPRENSSPTWGGYAAEFKLMEGTKFESLTGDIAAIRRDSLVIGPGQQRTFRIDLSKCEYVNGKIKTELDKYEIYVYTAEMIAIEKLRAICQQMPEYTLNRTPSPRARDFYDIHLIASKIKLNFSSNEILQLTEQIFAAKEVLLSLLGKIEVFREFHRPDWESVKATTKQSLEPFDYYFDFVVETARSMKPLWDK